MAYKLKKHMKKWHKNNKDKIKERQKEYYKNNKDKRKEYQKEYRENNKDKRREYNESNKDKIREYTKEYCENNKDKIREYMKEYRRKNKDDIREHQKEYMKEYYLINRNKIKEYRGNNGNKIKEYNREYNKSCALYNTFISQISYAEPTRRDPENWELLQVKCAYCGKWFNPIVRDIYNRIKALEGYLGGEIRLYCSKGCKKLCPTYHKIKYSAEESNTKQLSREVQPELRQMVFERDEWTCIKCGETIGLQCHHIEGIRWNPIESADIDICVTFCIKCHGEAHKDKGCRYIDMRCQ